MNITGKVVKKFDIQEGITKQGLSGQNKKY
jgi:hypothetical protein